MSQQEKTTPTEAPTLESDQFRVGEGWEPYVQRYDRKHKYWIEMSIEEVVDQLNTYYHQNRHMSWIISPEGMGK